MSIRSDFYRCKARVKTSKSARRESLVKGGAIQLHLHLMEKEDLNLIKGEKEKERVRGEAEQKAHSELSADIETRQTWAAKCAIASMIINIIHNIIVIIVIMMIIVVVVVYRHRFGRLASQMAMPGNALDISISRTRCEQRRNRSRVSGLGVCSKHA